MPLNPPDVERLVFRKTPLKVVVAQLKFNAILSIPRQEFVAPFQELLRQEYPVVQQTQTVEVPLSPSLSAATRSSMAWRFVDSEENWIVSLAPDFISLETLAYTTFEDFSDRFDRVLRSLVNVFQPNPQTRIGLRYINEMSNEARPHIGDWRGLINDALLGALCSEVFDEDVREAVHVINSQQPDGTFALRFAVKTEGGSCKHILDFDYYNEEQKPIDVEALANVLRGYNGVVYKMFRWCIEDELLEQFEPIR